MSDRVLIGGIGNVLVGDDAVGPYVVRLLESQYSFPDNVEIADLGTPALDLTHRIAGLRAVILVDCVASNEHPPRDTPALPQMRYPSRAARAKTGSALSSAFGVPHDGGDARRQSGARVVGRSGRRAL
jgi:hypothetical protein